MQTGEGSEEIVQANWEKAQIESSLQEHKECTQVIGNVQKCYRQMQEWVEKDHRKQGQLNIWRRRNLGRTQVFI